MAKQKTTIAKILLVLALTMLVSNTVIQFIENLTKNFAIAVIIFIAFIALVDSKILQVWK